MEPKTGLYEEVVSAALKSQLEMLKDYDKETKRIDPEEAYLILSKYTGQVIRRALRLVREDKHNSDGDNVDNEA